MQFLPTPMWAVILGEFAWQTSHGAAGISYAFLNATMRKELVKIFCFKFAKVATTTTPATANTNIKKSAVSLNDRTSQLDY